MDLRLRRRITMFYLAGVINVFLGLYVLIEGPAFLERDTVTWIALFFLAFAGVDFWFPYAMKKKWREEQARRSAGNR
jgi:hypothetical protein